MTENKRLLNDEQLNGIKKEIEDALLKRHFLSPIKTIKENVKHQRIDFETESFQTTPVIYKELSVVSFGSTMKERHTVREDREDEEFVLVCITVAVKQQAFDTIVNYAELFYFSCEIHGNLDNEPFRIKIL